MARVRIGYPDQGTAEQARGTALRLADELVLRVEQVAVISRDVDGTFHVHTSHDGIPMAGGAIWGGFWGLLFGTLLLLPLAGWALGAGVGARIGYLKEKGIGEDFQHQVHEHLQPGTSALFLVIDQADPDKVGFGTTAVGIGLLLGLVSAASSSAWAFAPGLLLIGLGLGVMLTPSVNLVQSAFPEEKQGEISGLSRSVSNLGSTFGTAIAGTILVSNLVSGNGTYVAAMIVLAVVALAGLGIAIRLPANRLPSADPDVAPPAAASEALDTAV